MARTRSLTLNALRIAQRSSTPIYVFGIEGKLIHQIASVSYAERTRDGLLSGYQRGKVNRHVNEIYRYICQDDALLPNAIVLALGEGVDFVPLPGCQRAEWGTFGTLKIPLPRTAGEAKPAWIVDGQQRSTALARLDAKTTFPVAVVAFLGSPEVQREQFLLVNKTKPLPRDLVNEILPKVETVLPKALDRTRVAAKVLEILRFSKNSPFYERVKGLGGVGEGCNISQAAVSAVIVDSIKKNGVLFDYVDEEAGKFSYSDMANVVSVFYEGVRRTWPEAWSASPKNSRLVHGVGIVALGSLMDRVMREVNPKSKKASSTVAKRLEPLKNKCAWTDGRWPKLKCEWNELQNTSQDKARLTSYLIQTYERCRRT